MISNIVITGKLSDVKLSAVKGIYQCECILVCTHTDMKIRTRFRYHPKHDTYANGDYVLVSGYLVPYLDGTRETLAIRASQASKVCEPKRDINIVTLVGVVHHRKGKKGFSKILVRNFGRTFDVSVVGEELHTTCVGQTTAMLVGSLGLLESGDLGVYCCEGGAK